MVAVGKKRRDPQELAALVQVGLAKGLDVVAAFRAATAHLPAVEAREMDREHRKAVEQHRRAVKHYEHQVRSLQTRATTGTAVAGVAGAVGVIDVVSEVVTSGQGAYGPSWLWLAGAVTGAVVSVSARRALREVQAPDPVRLPPPPPPPLPRGARGAQEAAALTALRLQLASVVPAVERLHPGAGQELRQADLEAAPALSVLVDRLAVLAALERQLPGSAPAAAAATAAEEIRSRLAAGVGTYERLLAAAATVLAAPDLGRTTDEVLGPALDAMSAYAAGLARSAEAFGEPLR